MVRVVSDRSFSRGVGMRVLFRSILALGGTVLLATVGLVSLGSPSAGAAAANKSPILIGYMGDVTGAAASTFGDGPGGAQARVDLQNAEGGIDGHPIELKVVDTQTSPTVTLTAAQELVSDHVFGIMENAALFSAAPPYLKAQGIPVTGTGIDGPEWATDSNLFDALGPPIDGPIAGSDWTTLGGAKFFKELGVKRVAEFANATPSAVDAANAAFVGFQEGGLSKCYENTSVP